MQGIFPHIMALLVRYEIPNAPKTLRKHILHNNYYLTQAIIENYRIQIILNINSLHCSMSSYMNTWTDLTKSSQLKTPLNSNTLNLISSHNPQTYHPIQITYIYTWLHSYTTHKQAWTLHMQCDSWCKCSHFTPVNHLTSAQYNRKASTKSIFHFHSLNCHLIRL